MLSILSDWAWAMLQRGISKIAVCGCIKLLPAKHTCVSAAYSMMMIKNISQKLVQMDTKLSNCVKNQTKQKTGKKYVSVYCNNVRLYYGLSQEILINVCLQL